MYLIYHAIKNGNEAEIKEILSFEFTPSQWWYENEPL